MFKEEVCVLSINLIVKLGGKLRLFYIFQKFYENNFSSDTAWYFPYFVTAQWLLILSMVAFLSLFIYYLVRLIKHRKIEPTNKRFFPKVLGFLLGFFFALIIYLFMMLYPK